MHVLISIWAVFAAWRWADWSRFSEFHATMIYMPAMNLLYFYLTDNYRLWVVESHMFLSNPQVNLLYTFVVFPCTVIIFLSHFPDNLRQQIFHYLKWILIYFVLEWIGGRFGYIHYHHGWTLWWSLLFLMVMFPVIRLHYRRPVWTYIASIVFIVLLISWFNVPWESLVKTMK